MVVYNSLGRVREGKTIKADSIVLWVMLNGRFGALPRVGNINVEKVRNEDMCLEDAD